MGNYNQAPVLRANGDKERKGLFVYRPQELEYAICCCLGNRDMVTLKTMLFFTGNSTDGDFRVAQKTILDRMNISEKRYYEARKKLEEMHWIHYDSQENAIYVNYNKIYADYKEYLKNQKDARGCNDSPIPVSIQDSPALTELQEQSSDSKENGFDDSLSGSRQDRYNNINNNIINNINKKITGSGAGVATAAPLPKEEGHRALKELQKWMDNECEKLYNKHGRQYGKTKEFDRLYDEFARKEANIRRRYDIPKDTAYL